MGLGQLFRDKWAVCSPPCLSKRLAIGCPPGRDVILSKAVPCDQGNGSDMTVSHHQPLVPALGCVQRGI